MPVTSINKPIDLADAITSVVATFKQRDQWSRKTARDPRVKLMHRHVLRSLALFAHTDSGGTLVFDPTYDELAKAARCHKRTAQRAVAVAEEIGIVRKKRHSDGRVSNAYELLLPQAGSNGVKFSAPTVTNSGADEGPNGDKLSIPTATNLADAERSIGGTAAAVLRVESKEERKKLEEIVLNPTTTESADRRALNERPIAEPRAREPLAPEPREPLTPMQRAEALHETVEAQQYQPSRNDQDIGRPAANGADADAERATVLDHGRKVLGAGCDALTVRLLEAERALDALGAAKRVFDALDIAQYEDDPRAHIENEIAVTLHVATQ